MFWINVTRKEQTTDEAKVAEWVKNGDEVDIYTWCDPCGCYIQAKFNCLKGGKPPLSFTFSRSLNVPPYIIPHLLLFVKGFCVKNM